MHGRLHGAASLCLSASRPAGLLADALARRLVDAPRVRHALPVLARKAILQARALTYLELDAAAAPRHLLADPARSALVDGGWRQADGAGEGPG